MDPFEKLYKEAQRLHDARKKGKKQENFHEVILFALEQEQDEYQFYIDLARRVESKDLKKRMIRQAKEELAHGVKLVEILKGQCVLDGKKRQEPPKLHIADYTVPKTPLDSGPLSYQDALILAIKKEQANHHLYQDLAKISACPESREVFQFLMAQEARHLELLEREYDENILVED